MNCGEGRPVDAQDREQTRLWARPLQRVQTTPSEVQGTLQKKTGSVYDGGEFYGTLI